MKQYAPIFADLTERQRAIMARLAVDDVEALADKATVAELTDLGLVYEALDETNNVSALFMPHAVHIAWRDWYSEHLTAEDIANADTDDPAMYPRAGMFLAKAEAATGTVLAPPPPEPQPAPRRRPGRPRKARA